MNKAELIASIEEKLLQFADLRDDLTTSDLQAAAYAEASRIAALAQQVTP